MSIAPGRNQSGVITTIVLDFDGVIADTEQLHLKAFQDAFAHRGWHLGESEYFDRYIGFDDRGLVVAYARDRRLAINANDIDALAAAKARLFSHHLSATNILFAGAKTAIERLATRYSLGIASGALHHEIAAILRSAGLFDLIPVIVGADDVTTSKPSPEPYLLAAAHIGVPPSACVAVEDSLPGLEAARAAGMRTIAVTTTSPIHDLEGAADRIVASLAEVSPDLVAELGAQTAL